MSGVRWIGAGAAAVLLAASGVAAARIDDDEPRRDAKRGAVRPLVTDGDERPDPTTTVPAPVEAEPAVSAPRGAAALASYRDCEGLENHVRAAAVEHVTAWGLSGPGAGAPQAVAESTADASSGASAGGTAAGTSSPGFSTTNVQEIGVDEPDVVKNDGERGFTVFDRTLRSVTFAGGRPAVADQLDLGLPGPAELLVVGDRVVALASDGGFRTHVVVVDARDAGDLAVDHRVEIEGAYVSARQVGETVRLVVTQNGPAFDFTYPRSDDEDEVARALAHNRAAVERAALAEWLPDVIVGGRPTRVPAPRCDDTFVTQSFAGPGSTTVVTLSPDDGDVVDAASVLATASEVYATAEHLYVATSSWTPAAAVTTEIHRFDTSDPRRTVYEASGVVPGQLLQPPWFVGATNLGQWSLSEHGGDLRVATTVLDGAGQSNAVTVVRRVADRLVPIGAVGGLGVNEQLYAVRFMGTRGYVVTYRKVDPLYVLDLSDPTAPRVAGELKVPGYSAYLHPIDDGLLLGIGQADDDKDGLADGTKVSLFDVSDPAAPRQLAAVQLGERGSVAGVESDHRSFTWWPDPARAVLTMTNWEDPTRFHGAIAVDVGAGGLHEIGRVEHRRDGAACAVPIVRSRVIGDALLTFSPIGIDVHALDDLAPRESLRYDDAATPCGGRQFAGG